MNALRKLFRSTVVSDQRGLTTVEYVIALGLIAAVAVGSWQEFGKNVKGHLTTSTTNIENAFNAKP